MSDATSQMLNAHRQFFGLVRTAVPAMGVVLLALFLLELFFRSGERPNIALGAFVGVAFALVNLWLLFRLMAPFFFFQRKAFFFLGSLLISLILGISLFVLTLGLGNDAALGFAFGLTSPAAFGVLYSFGSCATTSNTEDEDRNRDLTFRAH